MTTKLRTGKSVVKRLKAVLYDVVGEVHIKEEEHNVGFPIYLVDFFICLRDGEEVVEVDYPIINGDRKEDHTKIIQSINITIGGSSNGASLNWVAYQFEITKYVPSLRVLEFTVNHMDTDPKPKIVYIDPIDIEPDQRPPH